MMLLNYLKTSWRTLMRYKGYSIINITGLSMAMAVCVLINMFVAHELRFDKQVPYGENVFRLNEFLHYDGTTPQLGAATGLPVAPLLKADYSEINDYVRVFPSIPYIYPSITLEYQGRKIYTTHMLCTDSSFGRMFGIQSIEGSQKQFMPLRNSIVLTQSMSRKLFGADPALNKMVTLRVDDSTAYSMAVSNVIPDFLSTSHIQGDGLIPFPESYLKGVLANNYGVLSGPSYLRLRPGTDITTLEKAFTKTIHEKNKGIDIRLQRLANIHTKSMDLNYDTLNAGKIEGKYLNVFTFIATAIFLIACSNFVNLTLAIAAYRGKEVAVKKILGATRGRLVVQVFTEAFLSVVIAALLSLVIAMLCLPFLNTIVGRALPEASLFRGAALGQFAAMIVFTALLTAAYPAFLIARARIDETLRSRLLFGRTRTNIRNVLVVGQFAIALVFIIGLLVFEKQMHYLENKDLGYSYEQVIRVPLDLQTAINIETLRNELEKVNGVQDITYGYLDLGGKAGTFGVEYVAPDGTTKHISANMENVRPNYVGFFNMKIVAGRDFTHPYPQNEYLINESMATLLGYADPTSKEINLAGGFPKGIIVGVVKDFNYGSLHDKVAPLLIFSTPRIAVWKRQLYIKVATGGIGNTLIGIESVLKPFFHDNEPGWQFLNEHFKQVYNSEKEAGKLIAIIGGLAVFIACLGLLALAAFVIVRRTKEIGIRKVLGASVGSIVAILSKEFIRLVAIGFLIAAPIAGWMMTGWLQGFAYRVGLSWNIFVIAGMLAVGLAFLTISFISIRAARANPVNSLRSEV